MPDNFDPAWLEDLLADAPGVVIVSEWPAASSLLFAADGLRAAQAGAAMRDVGCLRCDRPVQGEPFQVWTMTGPNPCESNGSHLTSVTALLHFTCMGIDAEEIGALIRARTADCFDQ